MVHDALSDVCGTQVLPRVDNAQSKKNHFNFKPNCHAKRLWPGHDFCQGQMMHKPRKRELPILLTAQCLDKIHIFVKFRHHIRYGSEAVAYKQHFAKDRQLNS